jgi:hypothetical protein
VSEREITVVRSVLFALVALLPVSAGATGDPTLDLARASGPGVRLVWIDVLGSASFALPSATGEVAAILGEAGVATAWTLGAPSTEPAADELAVLILGDAAGGGGDSGHVMGSTQRGGTSRAAWVYLTSVLWALGLQGRSGRSLLAAEQEEVGRALGRVVAHEIVHVLAPELPHRGEGLMAGHLPRALLVCPRLSLSPREARAVRAGLRPRHSRM